MDAIAQIFEYDNYRDFLREVIKARKSQGLPCSFRWLSAQAGYRSPNFLKLVIDGQRELTPDGVERVAKVFRLTPKQADYFQLLVQYQRAVSIGDKIDFAEKIVQAKPKTSKVYQLQKSEFSYHRKWSYVLLREIVGSKVPIRDEGDVSKFFDTGLSRKEIQIALTQLLDIGLIQRNADGFLEVRDAWVKTPYRTHNSALFGFHIDILDLAKAALAKYPSTKRQFHGLTLPLDEVQYQALIRLIEQFKEQARELLDAQAGPQNIYQVNIQAFPMAERRKG